MSLWIVSALIIIKTIFAPFLSVHTPHLASNSEIVPHPSSSGNPHSLQQGTNRPNYAQMQPADNKPLPASRAKPSPFSKNCSAWNNLFHSRRPVSKRLTVELFRHQLIQQCRVRLSLRGPHH